MDLSTLETFFFWCTVINFGLYLFTVIAILLFKKPVLWMHRVFFNMAETEVMPSLQNYLGRYKLLITVFNFVPWLAIWIMQHN